MAGGARTGQAAVLPGRAHQVRQQPGGRGAGNGYVRPDIPDEAFDPVTGDDKKVASALKKRNKEERKGQLTFDLSWRARRASG